mmetsp:Transcript_9873/g.19568  ORF Transcript_9873/g.19568 Transcript_9873/m.19568 type:complete len:227 (+) Transcript_9873:1412-2092(+)
MQSSDDESVLHQVSMCQQTEETELDLSTSLRVTVRPVRGNSAVPRASTSKSVRRLPTLLKKRIEIKQARLVFFDELLSELTEQQWKPPVHKPPKMAYVPRSQQSPAPSLSRMNKSASSANFSQLDGCQLRIVSAVTSSSFQELPIKSKFNTTTKTMQKVKKTMTKRPSIASRGGYRTKLQKDPVIVRTTYGQYVYADTYERDASFLNKTRNTISRVSLLSRMYSSA